jgi:AraC family transcriptional regulator of adaptative response/methylated-DNA-[protein]-cysteine methyltransferase
MCSSHWFCHRAAFLGLRHSCRIRALDPLEYGGDDPEMPMSDLQIQFPNDAFEIIENDDAELVAKVVELIERPEQASELPVDIRGTDLRTRVWDALQSVPAGTTMNYTFLAEQIGPPGAS